MPPSSHSARIDTIRQMTGPFLRFFNESSWSKQRYEPGICDFAVGNPHEMPLPEFVDALRAARRARGENREGHQGIGGQGADWPTARFPGP